MATFQPRDAMEHVPSKEQKTQEKIIAKKRGIVHPVRKQGLFTLDGLPVSQMNLKKQMKRLVTDHIAFQSANSLVLGFNRRVRLSLRHDPFHDRAGLPIRARQRCTEIVRLSCEPKQGQSFPLRQHGSGTRIVYLWTQKEKNSNRP